MLMEEGGVLNSVNLTGHLMMLRRKSSACTHTLTQKPSSKPPDKQQPNSVSEYTSVEAAWSRKHEELEAQERHLHRGLRALHRLLWSSTHGCPTPGLPSLACVEFTSFTGVFLFQQKPCHRGPITLSERAMAGIRLRHYDRVETKTTLT